MRHALTISAIFLLSGLAGCFGGPADVVDDADPRPLATLSRVLFDTILREPLIVESTEDGVPLRVDVYRPDGDGPFPTILVQSPYWSFGGDAKDRDDGGYPTWYIEYFVPRGYAVALGEMRGTRDSGGCWDFGGRLDQQDGHDIVEALAAQGWSNGKVGMLGQSHVGMSQIAAAITAPPHLTTIVPIAAVSDWYRYLHKGGAPYVLNRGTPPAYFAVHASPSTESVDPAWVLTQAQTACVDNAVHVSQSAELDGDKDAYWQERDLIAGAANINASVFLVHGFLDENVKTDHFLDFWNALPPTVEKKAWFGQWFHEHPSFHEWRDDLHRWFDYWLMGIENGILHEPTVTLQDSTGDAWTSDDWPPAAATVAAWSYVGGVLAPASDDADESRYTYRSVPGQDRGGPFPPGSDVVSVASAPLDDDLHLSGQAVLNLTGILDQPTGRWVAVLYDVDESGARDEVTRAYLDARHRDGWESGEDVPVGVEVTYQLEFYPRDHVVEAGHTLVLEFLPGDLGCNASGETCEGTGIIPVERPVTQTVVAVEASESYLYLPVLGQTMPAREITELDDWLANVPP